MSMLLMVAAMKAKLGNPIRKLVLIKLADNANGWLSGLVQRHFRRKERSRVHAVPGDSERPD